MHSGDVCALVLLSGVILHKISEDFPLATESVRRVAMPSIHML